jgi:hypothetical protein
MVALAGAAVSFSFVITNDVVLTLSSLLQVCSIIMRYSSDLKYDRDFNSELYGGIYKTLVGTLNSIFKTSERKFHVLMHSLYKTV